MSIIPIDLAVVPASRPKRAAMPLAVVAGLGLALAILAPQAWSVWSRDTFLDPDDALRTVQLRDFMAGQPWFDLVPHRLAPSHSFMMHWSRLVDALLAVIQLLFELGLPAPLAERAMRIAAPLLFLVATLLGVLRLTAATVGPRGLIPAALLLATSAEPMSNFVPGHIHHHGLQDALLVLATAALVEAAAAGRRAAQAAAIAGALAMLSLGIGLQNLPYVVGMAAAVLLLWVAHGAVCRPALVGFALGLLAAVPVFALDVPPGHYAEGACDAFSAAHLVAACATAALCLGLAMLTPLLGRRGVRLAVLGGGAALVLGLLAWAYPSCLGDPMSGVDPLLRQVWLSGVGEALPLWRLIGLAWPQGITLLLTLAAGLLGTVLATLGAAPAARARWAVLLLLAGIGMLGTLWQVRVAASTCILLAPGPAWAVLRVFDRLARRPGTPALLIAALVGLFGNGTAWTALAVPLSRGTDHGLPGGAACFDPANYGALAALPPGLVLSTIDPGSTLLAYTGHTVLAAPYHRNAYGNRLSLLALAATPDAAEPLVVGAGVRYLALCRASNETAETVAAHPESLSAALMAGRVPGWLEPVGGRDAIFLLYRVRSRPTPEP